MKAMNPATTLSSDLKIQPKFLNDNKIKDNVTKYLICATVQWKLLLLPRNRDP